MQTQHRLGRNDPAMAFRALLAALFILAGIRKIMTYSATTAYFGGLGLPLPWLVTPLVIALEIVLPLLFIKGWRLREVGIVLAIYTLATGAIAHQFWVAPDAQVMNQFNHFFKNIAITGGFLLAAFSENAKGAEVTAGSNDNSNQTSDHNVIDAAS